MKVPLLVLRQFMAAEHPLKMSKNVLYFMLKVLFVLKIIKFLPWNFDDVGRRLNKKAKVSFKMCDVTSKQQIITIHILPHISRKKGNRVMKFGQVIEYNGRNVFLTKSCRKWDRETSSRPLLVLFLKKALYKVKVNVQYLSFNHSQKKRKISLETRPVYIEISIVSWSLPNGTKHLGLFLKNVASSKGDQLLTGAFHAIKDKTDADILQIAKKLNWKWIFIRFALKYVHLQD